MADRKDFRVTGGFVSKLWYLIDKGLPNGLGDGGKGNICVQAAVNATLDDRGLYSPDDAPYCVAGAFRVFGIGLNDAEGWASNKDRAAGLREYAVAQLGNTSCPIMEEERIIGEKLKKRVDSNLKDAGYSDYVDMYNGDLEFADKFYDASQSTKREILGIMARSGVEVAREVKSDGAKWLDEYNAAEDKKAFLIGEQVKANKQEYRGKKKSKKALEEFELRYSQTRREEITQ